MTDTKKVAVETLNSYFASYEDIEVHRLMILDKPRTEAYKKAIESNKHLFKGKVVMDVGAGTGILSLFIAKAGAKKVYSVEASNFATMIPSVAKLNGFSDVIEVLHDRVENVTLPNNEKIDVIVSEWMGFYLLHESMLSSVIYARDKFLTEEGTMFPSEARMYVCPCSLENFYKEQFYFWEDVYGFDLSPLEHCAFNARQIKPEICDVKSSDLLADPVCIKTLNMRYITDDEIRQFSQTSFVGIKKSGNYQGLAVWFTCEFDGRDYDEDGVEFGASVSLSTSPFDPATHWKQTVIMFGALKQRKSTDVSSRNQSPDSSPKIARIDAEKCEKGSVNGFESIIENESTCSEYLVEEDEIVGWSLHFERSEENERNYNIMVEMLDPEEVDHPLPCSCPMPRCLIIAKMIEKELNEDTEES